MRYEFLERKVMTAGQYQEAVETFISVLKGTSAKDKTSLLVFGSFLDDRLKPGLSDIDMVLFFWDEFVLDKKMLVELSDKLREVFSFLCFDVNWFFDLGITDLGNAGDGRFFSCNENFCKIFGENDGDGKLVYGKNFIRKLKPVRLTDPVEARIAYNLASLRLYTLFGRCNKKWAGGANPYRELKVFQQVRSLGRKTMQLVEPENLKLVKNKQDALRALKNHFPKVDVSALFAIEDIFDNRERVVDMILGGETFRLLVDALDCYERIVRETVKTLPMQSVR